MSKPDKYGDSLERDAREDFPEMKDGASKGSAKEDKHSGPAKEDKRSSPSADEDDDLDSSDEFLGDRRGMGKEIKIGLAVIAALLVVLAVVVVKRITRPADEIVAGGPETAKHEEGEEPSPKRPRSSLPRPRARPPWPRPPEHRQGREEGHGRAGWTFASDDREPPRVDSRNRPEAPIVAKEPGNAPPNRHTESETGPGGRAAGWPNDMASRGAAAGERSADPLADRSIPAGRDFAGTPGSDDHRRNHRRAGPHVGTAAAGQ